MSEDLDTAKTKGDPIVQYCAICGVEYDDRMNFLADSSEGYMMMKG